MQNLTFNLGVDTNSAVSSINQFFNTFDQGAARASSKLRAAFNEPIRTEVEIGLKNGELFAKKVESVKNKSNQIKQVYKALNGEVAKTPNALKKQMSILKTLQGNTKKYKDGTSKVTAEWKKVEAQIKRVKGAQDRLTESGGGGMDNLIGKFAMVQTLANLGTAAIMGLGRSVGDLAATGVRMESLMLQLESFTGSSQAAKAVYEEFANTARKTPFNVEEIAQAGKIMMAFGVDTETAAEMTDRLAIAAAATGGDVNNLSRNLGQIAAQGQAYTRDLHQFAMQGLPIWDEMSKVTGKSVVELKKLASEGKISFSIVSKAIKNMTAEGTAFAENAKRMEQTFAGRMAQIETAATNLALGMVQAFNEFDQELGGILGGAMLEFAQALEGLAKKLPALGKAMGATFKDIGGILQGIGKFLAAVGGFVLGMAGHFFKLLGAITPVNTILGLLGNTLGKLTKPLQDAGLLLAALAGPAIVIGIGLVIKAIFGMMAATYAYIKAQIISLGLSGPTGWAILAGAAGATAGAYLMLKGNLEEANKEMAKSATEQEKNAAAAKSNAAGQELLTESIDDTSSALQKQAKNASLAAKQAKMEYDEQKRASDELKESLLLRIEDEKSAIDGLIESKKEAIEQEKSLYDEIKDKVKDRYDAEKQAAEESYDARLRLLDLERDRLGQKGPKERELYELNKQDLQNRLKSSDLNEKERLQIEARLERMGRQEQMERIAAQRKQVQLEKEKKLAEIEENRKKELEALEERHKNVISSLEKEVDQLEKAKNKLDEQKESIDRMTDGTKAYNGELAAGISALNTQIRKTRVLETRYRELAAIAARAKLDAQEAEATNARNAANNSGGGQPTTSNFAGGPIAAGTTSWVNELGKEAFLSASGRLSMINDTNGKWTAPTDGTIIPAHLTKQLDVPTGGINLNKAASANASRAGSGGMASMIRSIQGAMGGDTFNQSVTVQAANPTQAANNLMVEMTRLRRRRFR